MKEVIPIKSNGISRLKGIRWGICLISAAILIVLLAYDLQAQEEDLSELDWVHYEEIEDAKRLSTAVYEGIPYIAYVDADTGWLAVRKYVDNSWQIVGPEYYELQSVYRVSMVIYNGSMYIAFSETHLGMSLIRYDLELEEWEFVGSQRSIGNENPYSFMLKVNKGQPYVIYDVSVGNFHRSTYVKTYDEQQGLWVNVDEGKRLQDEDYTYSLDADIDEDTLYITRLRRINGMDFIVIEKLDLTDPGALWTPVTGTDSTWYLDNVFSNFTTYIDRGKIYNAHSNFYGIIHVKQLGTQWNTLGRLNPSVMYGNSQTPSPAIQSQHGVLYVAHHRIVDGIHRIYVSRFDGDQWTEIGTPYMAAPNHYFEYLDLRIDNGRLTLSMLETSGFARGSIKVLTIEDTAVLDIPPDLQPDTRERSIGDPIEISFEDDGQWQEQITSIRLGAVELHKNQDYTIGDGAIVIHPHVLPSGYVNITVLANGYLGSQVTQAVKPSAPEDASVSMVGNGFVRVGWSGVAGADEYKIYYGTTPEFMEDTPPFITVSAAVVSRTGTIHRLINGIEYYFVVTAIADGLEGAPSVVFNATPQPMPDPIGKPWTQLGAPFEGIFPQLTSIDGVPYMVYRDDGQASVLKWTNEEWLPVGPRKFSAGNAYDVTIAHSQGTPYVAYSSQGLDNKATVMHYMDEQWVTIGNTSPSQGVSSNIALAVYQDVPYIAFLDDNEWRIKRLASAGDNAGSWEEVGEPVYAQADSNFLRIAIDEAEGLLYAVFEAEDGAQVYTWNVTDQAPQWESIDIPIELSGSLHAIGTDAGRLYIVDQVWSNRVNNRVLRVWMYDQNTDEWLNLGGEFEGIEAAVDVVSGVPVIAYVQSAANEPHKVIVQQYMNGVWFQIGSAIQPLGVAANEVSLVVPALYEPMVAYYNGSSYEVESFTKRYAAYCTITLHYGIEEQVNEELEFPCGEPVLKPRPIIDREHYYFDYWSSESHTGQAFNFEQRVEESIDLYAVWRLPAPLSLEITDYGDRQLSLEWEEIAGATSYYVYRRTANDEFKQVSVVTEPFMLDSELVNGTTYYYAVTASDGSIESLMSSEVSEYPRTVSDAPSNVAATADGDAKITLSFDQPAHQGSEIIGYKVLVEPTGGDSYEYEGVVQDAMTDTESVTLQLSNIPIGIEHAFRVASINHEGVSDWSAASNSVVAYYACSYQLDYRNEQPLLQIDQPCHEPINEAVTRVGFNFEGWYVDEQYSIAFEPQDSRSGLVTNVYAKWSRTNEPLPKGEWHVLGMMEQGMELFSSVWHEGKLHVSLWDNGYVTIRRYNEGKWDNVGAPRFAQLMDSSMISTNNSISMSSDGDKLYAVVWEQSGDVSLYQYEQEHDRWSKTESAGSYPYVISLNLAIYKGDPFLGIVALTEEFEEIKNVLQLVGNEHDRKWVSTAAESVLADKLLMDITLFSDDQDLYLSYLDNACPEILRWSNHIDDDFWEVYYDCGGESAQFPMADMMSKTQLSSFDGDLHLTLTHRNDNYERYYVTYRDVEGQWLAVSQTPGLGLIAGDPAVIFDGMAQYMFYSILDRDNFEMSHHALASHMELPDGTIKSLSRDLQYQQIVKDQDQLYVLYTRSDMDENYNSITTPVVQTLILPVCEVSFESNGGSAVSPIVVDCGEAAGEPTTPTNEYYRFEGWYTDTELSNLYDFSQGVPTDITLYAKWEEVLPEAPTNLTVVSQGDGYVSLAWLESEQAQGYRIYVGIEEVQYEAPIEVAGTEYTVTNLTNAQQYYFTVTAYNPHGESGASEEVNGTPVVPEESEEPEEPIKPSQPNESSEPNSPTNDVAEMWVGGQQQSFHYLKVTKDIDGSTVYVSLDDQYFEEVMEQIVSESEDAITLSLQVKTERVTGQFSGSQLASLAERGARIELRTDIASYRIAADQLLPQEWIPDVPMEELIIRIDIVEAAQEISLLATLVSEQRDLTIVVPPIRFTATAVYQDQVITLQRFASIVEREIMLPDGVDHSKITTAVILDEEGNMHHVPTIIKLVDGRYIAYIQSLTNSDYMLIYNQVQFKDTLEHWGKNAIHELGSRLVVGGYGDDTFRPNQAVTRAEFAAMLIRGLGLGAEVLRDESTEAFTDSELAGSLLGAVQSAAAKGLIQGYPDGSFKPNEEITREQAMRMITQAFPLIRLSQLSEAEMVAGYEQLHNFVDAKQLSAWATDSAVQLITKGIIVGTTDGKLNPKHSITRAEAAAMIYQLLKHAEFM